MAVWSDWCPFPLGAALKAFAYGSRLTYRAVRRIRPFTMAWIACVVGGQRDVRPDLRRRVAKPHGGDVAGGHEGRPIRLERDAGIERVAEAALEDLGDLRVRIGQRRPHPGHHGVDGRRLEPWHQSAPTTSIRMRLLIRPFDS